MGMYSDADQGFKWYFKAASKGLVFSENRVGLHYQYGQGVTQSLDSALYWFKKAADKGSGLAEYNIGMLFSRSVSPPDPPEAFSWFYKSAQHNDRSGEYLLGWCYYSGSGTGINKDEGIKWMRKAAKDGNYDAKKMLNYLKITYE